MLLNLGMGGPGGGGFATRSQFEPLEQHFTVVSWDEPGTGKSIGAVPLDQLTKERFVQDGRALTELLLQRFGQQRIYLYGVSWSSILGIWLIQQYPQLYYAFVSSGQMVNTTENDQLGYRLALDYSRQRRGSADRGEAACQRATAAGGRTRSSGTSTTSMCSMTTWVRPVCAGGATNPVLRTRVRTGGQGKSHPRTD